MNNEEEGINVSSLAPLTIIKNILNMHKVSMNSASSVRDFLKVELSKYYELVELISGGYIMCESPKSYTNGDGGVYIAWNPVVVKCAGRIHPSIVEEFYKISYQIKKQREIIGLNKVIIGTQKISNDAIESLRNRKLKGLTRDGGQEWIVVGA
jgi:hypothetical protein